MKPDPHPKRISASQAFFHLVRLMGKDRPLFYIALALAVGDSLAQSLIPLFFRHILNHLQEDPVGFIAAGFWNTAGVAFIVSLLFFPVAYFFHLSMSLVATRLNKTLQLALYQHVLGLSSDFFQRTKVGEINTRLNSDVQAINGGFGPISQLMWGLCTFIFALSCAFWINWTMTLLILTLILIVIAISQSFMPMIREMHREVRDAAGEVSATITEYVGIQTLIKSYGWEDHAHELVVEESEKLRQSSERLSKRMFILVDTLQFVIKFLAPLLVLFIGGWMVARQIWGIGDLVAFWGYWMILGGTVQITTNAIPQLFGSLAAVDRVFEFFGERALIQDRPHASDLTQVRGELEFRHVNFRYPGNDEGPVIHDLSLHIPAGSRVALVGPSGAGKSTLLNLILRFHDPQTGDVFLDGTNLRDIKQRSMRRHIGIVAQESVFFSGTIADNLRLAREEASEQEMIAALEAASALEFIQEMEGGLNAVLGERGVRLSGGQKQRLSIARVFLKNPEIVLLDEATSALDSLSEQFVQEAMDRLMSNRTVIVVAHRISTVKSADTIVVMNAGKIDALGKHDALLESSPLYRHLCEHQGLV